MPFDALILSLPSRHATLRMRMWRALKDGGWGVLRDGVYVLPAGRSDPAVLSKLHAAIRGAGGSAMSATLALPDEPERARVLFDRSAQYGALAQKIEAASDALPRLGPRKSLTALSRLQRALDKLTTIDFFPGHAREQALRAMTELNERYQATYASGEPRTSRRRVKPLPAARYRRRIWATRQRPWVDRLASAWLIKRFIDREAKFLWLESPRAKPRQAIGFDFDGADFTHARSLVTFEVLAETFGLAREPAIRRIGAAVHFLDAGGIPVAEARGLETMLKGAREKAQDDDALLAEALRIFDLLYSGYSPATASRN
jgi:hypothetical protein